MCRSSFSSQFRSRSPASVSVRLNCAYLPSEFAPPAWPCMHYSIIEKNLLAYRNTLGSRANDRFLPVAYASCATSPSAAGHLLWLFLLLLLRRETCFCFCSLSAPGPHPPLQTSPCAFFVHCPYLLFLFLFLSYSFVLLVSQSMVRASRHPL